MYIMIHYDGDIGRPVVENIIWFFEIPKTIDRVACEIRFDYCKNKKKSAENAQRSAYGESAGFSKS